MARRDRRLHCSLFRSAAFSAQSKSATDASWDDASPQRSFSTIVLNNFIKNQHFIRRQGRAPFAPQVKQDGVFFNSLRGFSVFVKAVRYDYALCSQLCPSTIISQISNKTIHPCRLGGEKKKKKERKGNDMISDTVDRTPQTVFVLVRCMVWKHNYWCLLYIVWARRLIVVHRRAIHHISFIVFRIVSSPCHRQLCFISERPLRSSLHKKLVKTEGREEEALKQQRASPP